MLQFEEVVAEVNPVAVIKLEYTTIGNSNTLNFKESYDDLDKIFYAILPLPSNNKVALVSHKHSPNPGTEICVSYNQANIPSVISEVIETLNLTFEDLSWVHLDYEQELYKLKDLSVPPRSDEQVNYPQKLAGVDFSRCVLKNIDLEGAYLKKTSFREADLSKANLQRADLRGAKLQNASLEQANLQDADLRGAKVNKARFYEANLEGADFQYANLQGAILNGSNLDHASFKDANLENAQMYDIHWTTETVWFPVMGLHKAIGIPENLKKQSCFKHSVALSKGLEELKNGNLEQFRDSYEAVIEEIEDVEIIASLWHKLARLSVLSGHWDDQSYQAALKALQLKENQGEYHETLGMIFALRNDFPSAIKEFETALKSDDAQTWSSRFKRRRKKWIQALQMGENPFTSKELKSLRRFKYQD